MYCANETDTKLDDPAWREPSNVTILLVDDDEGVRRLSRLILEMENYQVLEAVTPADALLKAQEHRGLIQLLVTDVIMPGTNGQALAREISLLRPDIKVLFLSGHTHETIFQKNVSGEIPNFLQKPFGPASLLERVHEILLS